MERVLVKHEFEARLSLTRYTSESMTGQATNKREGAIVFHEWLVELGTDRAETIFRHFPELDNDEWWEMVKASKRRKESL